MENNLKNVISFEYADEGKKTVIVVKAANIEPKACDPLSAMVPGLTLTGGIVTELNENGQEVSETGSSPDAIMPCQDSYPDEILSAVIDMVSRGENVDPASGKNGFIKVLEACDEFQKSSNDWTDHDNIAFIMDGRPVPKEISHYASYYAIVGASKERLYYEGICYGGYICLDAKTRTIIEDLEDKEKETMLEDLHSGKLLWYTPGFPKLAEEARFGPLTSENDIFAYPSKIFNQVQDKPTADEQKLVGSNVIARAVISEAGTHAIFEVKADMVTVHNLDTDSANIPYIHVDGGVVNKYDLDGSLIEEDMAMPGTNSKYPDMANMFLNEVLLGGISRSENKVQNGFFIFGDKRPFQLDESGIVEILECCDEVRRCMDFWNSDKNILFADYDRSGRPIHKEVSFNGNFFGLFSITQNLIFYKKVDMFQDRTFYKHDTEPGDKYIAIDRVTGAVVLNETEVIPYIEDIEMHGKNCTLGVEFYEPLLSYALASQRLNH